jgi:hypothetical protein
MTPYRQPVDRMPKRRTRVRAGFVGLALCIAELVAAAEAGPFDLSGSGFLSAVAGKVVRGQSDPHTDLGYRCPCFVSDYGQNGVYENRGWQVGPDSRVGLQGTASVDGGRYSLTAQAVSRGSRKAAVDLEWLYASAVIGSDWTVQVGRKRLPLFLSSEVQDVGYALPWTHLAPQLYGWEVVNYNGASLNYQHAFGPWLANAQLLYGNETVRDSGYWQIYNGKGTRTDTRWRDIAGLELKFSRDWFEVRGVLIQSTTQSRNLSAGETAYSTPARQRIHGLSFNADSGSWVGRAEFLYIDRRQDYGFDHAQLYAAGRRFGPWLAMISHADYRQVVTAAPDTAEGHRTRSLVLRYDLGESMALKLQYDTWRDKTAPNYGSLHGNVQLISVGFDKVF